MDDIDLNGILIPVDPDIMSEFMIDRLRSGRYEMAESWGVPLFLREGDRVLELGCAIGYVSCVIAKDDRVTALCSYDANPYVVAHAAKVAERNGLAARTDFRHGLLLSDPKGRTEADFYVHQNYWASSLTKTGKTIETVQAPIFDFNQVVREFAPTCIICDIEGAELELLEHAEFGAADRVYIELHFSALGEAGTKRVYDLFAAQGFRQDQELTRNKVMLFRRD